MSQNLERALAQWRMRLGDHAVVTDPATLSKLAQNTTGYRPRTVMAMLRPQSAEQVLELVRIARQREVSLYPFSTGKNWGLGSKLPVTDSCVLVDLRGLNRIRDVDGKGHYAIIEAGVTQQQLHEHLAASRANLLMNVWGKPARWVFTGTPLTKSLMDSYAQCLLMAPERLPQKRNGGPVMFVTYRDMLCTQPWPDVWVPKPDALARVQGIMQPAIRFTRAEVMPSLAAAVRTRKDVPLSPDSWRTSP